MARPRELGEGGPTLGHFTTIRLSADEWRRLDHLSAASGRTKGSIIRAGVRRTLAETERACGGAPEALET